MTNGKELARTLSQGASAYCPASAALIKNDGPTGDELRTAAIAAEKANTARLRAMAFEAARDERQIAMI